MGLSTLHIHYLTTPIEPTVLYKLHIVNYLFITYFIDITDVFSECENVIILQGNSMALNIPSVMIQIRHIANMEWVNIHCIIQYYNSDHQVSRTQGQPRVRLWG